MLKINITLRDREWFIRANFRTRRKDIDRNETMFIPISFRNVGCRKCNGISLGIYIYVWLQFLVLKVGCEGTY